MLASKEESAVELSESVSPVHSNKRYSTPGTNESDSVSPVHSKKRSANPGKDTPSDDVLSSQENLANIQRFHVARDD